MAIASPYFMVLHVTEFTWCHDLEMEGRDGCAAGNRALSRGDWEAARVAFGECWDHQRTADALDGLGLGSATTGSVD
jgi:hypothetical protein